MDIPETITLPNWVISGVKASADQWSVLWSTQAIMVFSVRIFESQFVLEKVTFKRSLSEY